MKKRREARRFFDIAIAVTVISILSVIWVLVVAHIYYTYRGQFDEIAAEGAEIVRYDDISLQYTVAQHGIEKLEEGYDATGETVAYRVTLETVGYNRNVPIKLTVTVSKDATVLRGIDILKQKESEYYGARIAGDDFKERFVNRYLPVILQGEAGKGAHIEGVSGATVTSTAVFDAINQAKNFVDIHIPKGENNYG